VELLSYVFDTFDTIIVFIKQNKQSIQPNVCSVQCGAVTGGQMTQIFSDDELPHA